MKESGDKVNTKKLTESAVLSALFVMTGIVFISTFVGYQFYLDVLVPILITLIYLRCDFKYTLLSCLTSVALLTFIFGNPAYTLWIIQNMTIGFICGFLIKRDTNLMDDLFFCSLFATLILVFADIFLSSIIGYSFMAEAQEMLVNFEGYPILKDVAFYIVLAALPLGTVIMTYIAGIVLGKKLSLLNANALKKFVFIKKYKKYGSMQYCSQKTVFVSLIFLLFMNILGDDNILFNIIYFKTVLIIMKYITLYFIIKDSYSILCSYIFRFTSQKIIVIFLQLVMLYSLFTYFKIVSCVLIIGGIAIDLRHKFRKNTERLLRNVNVKYELQ